MGFKIGDNIVYAGSGVCQIDDIKDISFTYTCRSIMRLR